MGKHKTDAIHELKSNMLYIFLVEYDHGISLKGFDT